MLSSFLLKIRKMLIVNNLLIVNRKLIERNIVTVFEKFKKGIQLVSKDGANIKRIERCKMHQILQNFLEML